jgi:hypothetical protein
LELDNVLVFRLPQGRSFPRSLLLQVTEHERRCVQSELRSLSLIDQRRWTACEEGDEGELQLTCWSVNETQREG